MELSWHKSGFPDATSWFLCIQHHNNSFSGLFLTLGFRNAFGYCLDCIWGMLSPHTFFESPIIWTCWAWQNSRRQCKFYHIPIKMRLPVLEHLSSVSITYASMNVQMSFTSHSESSGVKLSQSSLYDLRGARNARSTVRSDSALLSVIVLLPGIIHLLSSCRILMEFGVPTNCRNSSKCW